MCRNEIVITLNQLNYVKKPCGLLVVVVSDSFSYPDYFQRFLCTQNFSFTYSALEITRTVYACKIAFELSWSIISSN